MSTLLVLDPSAAQTAATAAVAGASLGEVFAEQRAYTIYEVGGGEVLTSHRRQQRGIGVRRLDGDRVRLAHAATLDEAALPGLVAAVTGGTERRTGSAPDPCAGPGPAWPELAPGPALALARETERAAMAAAGNDDVACTVKVISFAQRVLVARPDRVVTDLRRCASLHIRATVRREQKVRWARLAYGAADLAGLTAGDRHRQAARRAVASAVERLAAVPAPAGELPVVLGPGNPAMLLHEACGHALEADLVDSPGAAYRGRFGTRVAAPGFTLIDDPGHPPAGAQYRTDDEGEPARAVTLVDDGVLTGRLLDRRHAARQRTASNGHGRRLSYAYPPLPRMAGTFVAAGTHPPEEIISATRRGLYVGSIGGGDTDLGSGRFNLQVDEAYLIEDGRLTAPVRGAVLSGSGAEVLAAIDLVGDDVELLCHTYICNKLDQFPLLVNLGQPTLRVSRLSVWGG